MSGGVAKERIGIIWPSTDKDAFSAGAHVRPYRRIRPHIPAISSHEPVVLKNPKNLLPRPANEPYPKVSLATKKKKAAPKKRKPEVPKQDPADEHEGNTTGTKRRKRSATNYDEDEDDSDFTS